MKTNWATKAAVTAAMVMVLAGTAFAFQTAVGPAASGTAVGTAGGIGSGVLKGLLAGAIAAVVGYAAQQKGDDGKHEAFDIVQLVVTALIGALAGAYAGWKHLSLTDVENLPLLASVIGGIELVIKAVWRNSSVKLAAALDTLRAGTNENPTPPPPPKP